jgi:hypothetical protein
MRWDLKSVEGMLDFEEERLEDMVNVANASKDRNQMAYSALQTRISKQVARVEDLYRRLADQGGANAELEREAIGIAAKAEDMTVEEVIEMLCKAVAVAPPESLEPLRQALEARPRLKVVK